MIKVPPKPDCLWITNTSRRDVCIGDLYVTVRSYSSVNLLDNKHYHLTWEQIHKSITAGSIFKKRDKLAIRKNPPHIAKKTIFLDREAVTVRREKSIFEIQKETFEELDITDEQFAENSINEDDNNGKKN